MLGMKYDLACIAVFNIYEQRDHKDWDIRDLQGMEES